MAVQDLEAKRSKYKGQLMEVKTNKEYTAMLHEIEGVEREIRSREDQILQEMEHEVTTHDRLRTELARLDRLDAELIHLDAELNERQSALRALQKLGDQTPGSDQITDAKPVVKESIERLRKELRAATAQHRTLEAEIDHAFNPFWGPLFREGYEISKFGEQVEAYACVYTSRVSNFRFYSPMQYFRGPRDRMPHER